jgi:hypothetical protein
MAQTIEAEIGGDGTIRLREPVGGLGKARRALVIVLDEPPAAADDQPVDYSQVVRPPVDDWHRALRAIASPCGTPLGTTRYSREEIYD